MLLAEIITTETGSCIGQLCDSDAGYALGGRWEAPSRGELIVLMRRSTRLPQLQFVDRVDPMAPAWEPDGC